MDNIPTQAFIFSGGFGLRMRPITLTTHKSLIKVGGKPLLDYAIDKMAACGVTDIHVNTHYRADDILHHLKHRQEHDPVPRFHISYEPELLETGGTVALALPELQNQPFFTLNPDTLCLDGATPALHRLANAFDPDTMLGMLLVHPVEKAIGYPGNGDFGLQNNQLYFPKEKNETLPYVYTGIGIFHPRLWQQIELPTPPYSINHFFKALRDDDDIIQHIYGLVHDGQWLHIGTPEELDVAQSFMAHETAYVSK
ncbi:MAG: nucleotidyltransferase family protein [Alphaproteobacteria bacterium]|nr:nucleotidyltransferase family protein [Alphaproteobacteria bacterium]